MGVLKVTKTNKFLSSIAKHQKEQTKEKFSGFLQDYLEVLEADTTISGLSPLLSTVLRGSNSLTLGAGEYLMQRHFEPTIIFKIPSLGWNTPLAKS